MINKTNIDAEIKVACDRVIASNQRKARESYYLNDNAVIKKFIFDKTSYVVAHPYQHMSQDINQKRNSNIATFLVMCLLIGGGGLFILIAKLIKGYSLDIEVFAAAFLIVGAFYYRYQKRRTKTITLALLRELSTLNTLSEIARAYISKLLDQLPPESDPYLIIETIYDRNIDIYLDVEAVHHAQ